MSWETDWSHAVILAGNPPGALSILSLHLGPAIQSGCAVVSTGAVSASIPGWIEDWNPRCHLFRAYHATLNGDHAARRLIRNDTQSSGCDPPSKLGLEQHTHTRPPRGTTRNRWPTGQLNQHCRSTNRPKNISKYPRSVTGASGPQKLTALNSHLADFYLE